MTELPKDAICYKTSNVFTAQNLPNAFKKCHHTKAGVWGKVTVLSGSIELKRYVTKKSKNAISSEILETDQTTIFGPQEPHSVAFINEGSFTVSFYKIIK